MMYVGKMIKIGIVCNKYDKTILYFVFYPVCCYTVVSLKSDISIIFTKSMHWFILINCLKPFLGFSLFISAVMDIQLLRLHQFVGLLGFECSFHILITIGMFPEGQLN